jgi:hypothetical protein
MEETMLSLRKSIRLLGSGTVAMAFGAGLLGAAQAASATAASPAATVACGVLSPAGQPASDSIKLPNVAGISFGSGGLNSSGNPTCGGTLQWNIPPSTIQPRLTGRLYMKDSLYKTAHVRVSYYDIHGQIITGDISPNETATSNNQSFPVTLRKFNDPRFYRMQVSTEVLNLSGTKSTWSTVASSNAYMGSSSHPAASCQIDTSGVELGGSGGVSGGHPVNAASCGWVVNPTTVQARVTGRQYFENGLGRKARIVLSTFDVHGNSLGNYAFASNSPSKNGVVSFPVSGSSGSNYRIYRAQVVVQFQNGSNWAQQGNTVTWYI